MRIFERIHTFLRGGITVRVLCSGDSTSADEAQLQRNQIQDAMAKAPRSPEAIVSSVADLSFCRHVEATSVGESGVSITNE